MASGAKEGMGESGSAAEAEPLKATVGSECPICLDVVRKPAFVAYCMHQFCFSCICHWAQAREGCPVCRQSLEQVLHSVRGDDDYELFVVGLPTRLRRRMAMDRARGRRQQSRYDLRRRLATNPPAADQRERAFGRRETAPGRREPLAGRREPVAGQRDPVAGQREPMAGRREPVAGRRDPVTGQREPVAGQREPVARQSELVDTESSQGQGAVSGPSRIPAQPAPSQEPSHRSGPGAPPDTQNGTE